MNIGILVAIVLSLIIVFTIILSVLRWQKAQQERKQKTLATLFNRSRRLLDIFHILPGRYLPDPVKQTLLEYTLSIGAQLVRENYGERAELNQAEVMKLFDHLQSENAVKQETRVASQAELAKIQTALQYLPRVLKNLAENRVISTATAKHHVALLRYTHSLAYRDLLVKQATQDLDLDKKSRALEKYRTALAEMERASLSEYSEKEVARLKAMIDMVEKELFANTK